MFICAFVFYQNKALLKKLEILISLIYDIVSSTPAQDLQVFMTVLFELSLVY